MTAAAGTAVTQAMTLRGQGRVVLVEVTVPAGVNGQCALRLLYSGTPVIPYSGDATLALKGDEVYRFTPDVEGDSPAWSVYLINNGVYSHTVQVRFVVSAPEPARRSALDIIRAAVTVRETIEVGKVTVETFVGGR